MSSPLGPDPAVSVKTAGRRPVTRCSRSTASNPRRRMAGAICRRLLASRYLRVYGPLRGQLQVRVQAEDVGQSRSLLLDGLLRWWPLVEPGHRELVALPRPRSADETADDQRVGLADRKSTRLNSSHMSISYAVFCL